VDAQLEAVVAGLRDVFGDELIGIYLHGSAVLGGLRPRSDLDVIAVTKRRSTREERRALAGVARTVSGKPRPLELDVVVQSEIRPWRHPARTDFHYFELHRGEWERGNLEPWSNDANVDLASVITMTLAGDAALFGPQPAEVFDPVPRRDYVQAVFRGVASVDDDLNWDTRNVILTLPRIWSAIATDEIHSKDAAAEWALAQLPEEHRPVLERARDVYRGAAEDPPWHELLPQVRAYAEHMLREIHRARDAS
jgi:streptomycin 3"-adenylyltransferase